MMALAAHGIAGGHTFWHKPWVYVDFISGGALSMGRIEKSSANTLLGNVSDRTTITDLRMSAHQVN
jgi:hypothetical protein